MGNIKTLSEATSFLKNELINEIQNHAHFTESEVSQLADIIVEVFKSLDNEVNGYDE